MRTLLLALMLTASAAAQGWFRSEPLPTHSTGTELPEVAPRPHREPAPPYEPAPTFVVSIPGDVLEMVYTENVKEVAALYGFPIRFVSEPHAATGYAPDSNELSIQVDMHPQGPLAERLGWSDTSGVLYLNLDRIRANVARHDAVRQLYRLEPDEAVCVVLTNTLKHELLVHFSGFAVRTRMTVFKDIFDGYETPGYLDSALPQDLMNLATRELNPQHPFLQSAYWRAFRLATRDSCSPDEAGAGPVPLESQQLP